MKFFNSFADNPFGSWVVNGLAVLAFFVAIKIVAQKLGDKGLPGAIKGVVSFA